MKQKNLIKFWVMAMMAAVCVTFAACGGDSDDDDIPGGGTAVKLKEGVHRIEVSFKQLTMMKALSSTRTARR